jgi:type II secretory pathway component PulF
MLKPRQKLSLFKLLAQAAEHKIKEGELFLLLSQKGPADLKEPCAQAAIEIKKNSSFAVAGLKAEVFDKRESKAIKTAIENGRLLAALRTFTTYYELRINRRSHFKYLWPYCFIVLTGIILAPFPEFYFNKTGLDTYLLQTIAPLTILLPILWLLDHPTHLISSKFSQDLGIPKLLLKIPSIASNHINNEMGSFLESTGMMKLCGYNWRQAIENSVPQVNNPVIRNSLGVIMVRMQRRDTFVDSLKRCEYFPENYINILHAAEKANQVPGALIRFKANQIIKSESKVRDDIKMPARTLSVTAGFLFCYAAFQALTLGGYL